MSRILLGIVIFMFIASNAGAVPNPILDLLNGHDWNHYTGGNVTSAGVVISPVGRAIVPQVYVPQETADSGEFANDLPAANPPINLRGPILHVEGNFVMTATLVLQNKKGAFLDFYGTMPIIYDEWRQEGKRLRVGVEGDNLVVIVWDGQSAKSKVEKFAVQVDKIVTLTIQKDGMEFSFEVNGKWIGSAKDPGIFSNKQVIFGADAEIDGGFTIQSLTAEGLGNQSNLYVSDRPPFSVCSVPDNALRSLAFLRNKPIYVGAAVAVIPLLTDENYRKLVGQEFSMITPENDMKFQFIHPQPNVYAFQEADAIVEFAELNKIRVHGHALVWHEALPVWVTKGRWNAEDIKKILAEHITKIVSHYRGRVAEWDVVNEPLKDMNFESNHGLRSSNPWFQSMGEEYIDFAFRTAHNADPNAKLYLNEYGIEEPGEKFEVLYSLLKRLLARGVPIQGIGFQMHEDMEHGSYIGTEPKLAALNMKRIAALGLDVRISEMDVNVNGRAIPAHLAVQGKAFRNMLDMALQQKKFTSFGVWGVTDRYSSLAPQFEYFTYGNGLLFDSNYKAKPAYIMLKEVLSEKYAIHDSNAENNI